MVIPLRYGNTNTFLIKGGKGSVLVDTDYAGTMPAFYKTIKAKGVKVSDITYVLATHYHPDHIGLVSELMDQGVKLVLLESQTRSVHFSDRIFENESRIDYKPIDEKVALILRFEESRSFFEGLGIEGEIIATLSHSEDSISVILDEGICLVGDLEPYEYLEAYEDNEKLRKDWEKVISFHPRRVCYAHANEKLIREMNVGDEAEFDDKFSEIYGSLKYGELIKAHGRRCNEFVGFAADYVEERL